MFQSRSNVERQQPLSIQSTFLVRRIDRHAMLGEQERDRLVLGIETVTDPGQPRLAPDGHAVPSMQPENQSQTCRRPSPFPVAHPFGALAHRGDADMNGWQWRYDRGWCSQPFIFAQPGQAGFAAELGLRAAPRCSSETANLLASGHPDESAGQ